MMKPKYTPTLSLGNVLTLVGGLFVAAGVWVALEVGVAEAKGSAEQNAKAIEELDARITRMEQRTIRQFETLDGKLDKVLDRID